MKSYEPFVKTVAGSLSRGDRVRVRAEGSENKRQNFVFFRSCAPHPVPLPKGEGG